jgi:hypothetical protein
MRSETEITDELKKIERHIRKCKTDKSLVNTLRFSTGRRRALLWALGKDDLDNYGQTDDKFWKQSGAPKR